MAEVFAAPPARSVALDQRSRDSGGGETLVPKQQRRIALSDQIARERARALRGGSGRAIHIQRQANHEAHASPRVVEFQDRFGVRRKFGTADLLQRRRNQPRCVAHRNANTLLARVKPHHRAARRQGGGEVGEVEEGQGAYFMDCAAQRPQSAAPKT